MTQLREKLLRLTERRYSFQGDRTRLYATDPVARRAINAEFAVPPNVREYGGYGLFAGMK